MNHRPGLACAMAAALALPAAHGFADPGDNRARNIGAAVRIEHQAFEDAPSIGPTDALVTMELFFVPGSPDSHNVYRVLIELQRLHPTRLRAVFRPMERSAQVIVPAIALTAHARGKFFELMDAITRTDTPPGAQTAGDAAARLGIERTLVSRDRVDDAIMNVLRANRHRYFRLEATSLPAMLINGRLTSALYDRSVTVAELDREYQDALEAARTAWGQGVPRRALADIRARHGGCTEQDDEDDATSPPPEANDPAEFAPVTLIPTYHWRLGAQTRRGTGCPPIAHVGGRLDDGDSPGDAASGYLLAEALPTAGMPTTGRIDAPVTMHVLCNLRGSSCAEQLGRARRVAEYFGDAVRVVYSPWLSLARDGSDRDLELAEAALCAATSGDGWALIRAVTGGAMMPRKRPDLVALAHLAGLDADELTACAQNGAPRARAAIAAARRAGIGWGPTVVIGGRAYVGGFSDDRPAATVIEAELAPGLLEELIPAY